MIEGTERSWWRDGWRTLRNRLLASAAFRRGAVRFAPTRAVARRDARRLFDLTAGFVYSQVLLACVRLRLFDALAGAPRSLADLATQAELAPERAERLLRAAAALRLVERVGSDRWALGALGAVLRGSPAVVAMIEHHALLYADLADPVALLRDGPGRSALGRHWPYASNDRAAALGRDAIASYTDLMSASQPLIADLVLDAVPLGAQRMLLDVGGGDGTFVRAAARRVPRLRFQLFDLPAVSERARERFAATDLADRVEIHGGDFTRDALPRGADVATLVRVVHDHDDTRARALLRAVRAALPAGGMLIVAEPMAGLPGADAVADAYFGFYLLAMGSGRARTPRELTALLHEAGFESVRNVRTGLPLQTGVVVARVPAAPGSQAR
jgi:demethylspheroidene O-methyltransferase